MSSIDPIGAHAPSASAQADTRVLIVAEAKALFAHYGYSKTNISDIARAAGMSPANLYRYFRNKQAIGDAVVQLFLDSGEARVQAALARPAESAEARLRLFVTECVMDMVEQIRAWPKLVELAEMLLETSEGMALIEEHVIARHATLRELIESGRRSGEFTIDDADRGARAVQLATKFFHAPFAIARHGLDQVEEDLTITLDLLCAGLRAG